MSILFGIKYFILFQNFSVNNSKTAIINLLCIFKCLNIESFVLTILDIAMDKFKTGMMKKVMHKIFEELRN